MSVYLFFIGLTLATVGVGFVWLLLAAAGLVPDPTDPDPWPVLDDWETVTEHTPIFEALREEHDAFERDLARVHQLPEVQRRWGA